MLDSNHPTDTAAALAAGTALAEPKSANRDFVALPIGYSLHDLEPYHDQPRRLRQKVEAHTLEAFLAYWSRYADESTVIFVDERNARIKAIFDYHKYGEAAWCDHVLSYGMPLTPEWSTWHAKNNRPMSQTEFAEFVEDNLPDFAEPDGATMLELAKNLQATKRVEFASGINLHNGDVQLTYETETHVKGTIEVPALFTIGIAPFQGGDAYKVQARFRYRIEEKQLRMWYVLLRPDKVREDALRDVVSVLRAETPVDRIFLGIPSGL